MMHFEAVIFDMDGVVIDSEPRHERSFLEIFVEMGYGENHEIRFSDYYGKSDKALWIDFVKRHNPPQPLEELLAWKERHFIRLIREEEPIFPEIPKLIEQLAARYPLALASGSYHPVIDAVLAMQGLRRFFRAIVSAQDVPQGKPAPDIFLLAAERLGIEPRACCVLEDSAAGVEAALAAGMAVIAITNTLPAEQLQRATWVVKDYAEVECLLLGGSGE